MKKKVPYRFVAKTAEGFVQQLAVSYVGQGYWFYVTGEVPARKDPAVIDRKLIGRYGIDISKWARARRKRAGLANVHYLRFERFFILVATKGEHRFFEEEKRYRDVRRDSIHFQGYSVGYKKDPAGKWHPSVRIHPVTYAELKAYFLEIAIRRSEETLAREFRQIPFVPFAPIRTQFRCIHRAVNRVRKEAGLPALPVGVLNLRRRPVKVFVEDDGGGER